MKTSTPNRSHSNHPGSGFSLIELLIVVAIILIIAAISIPSILRARIAANQAGAVENCRTVSIGEVNYSHPVRRFFADTIGSGGPGHRSRECDQRANHRRGAIFGYAGRICFYLRAAQRGSERQLPGLHVERRSAGAVFTGDDHYFTDEPALIHVNHAGPASVNDPPIQ